jgi:hypothetical protein
MFLYKVTLKRPAEVEHLPVPRRPVKLPVVLSGTEVEAVLEAIRSPKYRGIIMVMYAGGLRRVDVPGQDESRPCFEGYRPTGLPKGGGRVRDPQGGDAARAAPQLCHACVDADELANRLGCRYP